MTPMWKMAGGTTSSKGSGLTPMMIGHRRTSNWFKWLKRSRRDQSTTLMEVKTSRSQRKSYLNPQMNRSGISFTPFLFSLSLGNILIWSSTRTLQSSTRVDWSGNRGSWRRYWRVRISMKLCKKIRKICLRFVKKSWNQRFSFTDAM